MGKARLMSRRTSNRSVTSKGAAMKAVIKKYLGEELVETVPVDLPDNYDGHPYGDTVPFVMASNWGLETLDD